jgi:uncharacterized protein
MPSMTQSLNIRDVDDLIYYARTGDLVALKSTVTELSTSQCLTAHQIIEAATDAEPGGAGPGCCLLHWPSANGNEEVLRYLLSSPNPKQDAAEGSVLNPASGSGFVNHKNNSGNTPLHWAALNGHLECVKALVAVGGDPAITNNAGRDALYEADCSGQEGGREVAEWILANCAELEKGSKVAAGAAENVGEERDSIGEEGNGT